VRTGAPLVAIDARALSQTLQKMHFERVLSVGELTVVPVPDSSDAQELVVRVLSVELDDDGDDDDGDNGEADALHVYRGRVNGRTSFFLRLTEQFGGVELTNANVKPTRAPKSCVRLLSADNEEFLIAKATLRPCIALTAVVRDTSSDLLDAHVDVDACTLDRAILFMQMFARRCQDEFDVPLNCIADLLAAAEKLQFSLLEDWCRTRLGDARKRIQVWRWADVKQSIAERKMWLLIDGGVFDVTAWLPRHPGGAKIIPAQALGVDCTVYFELYHASRESFEYLQQFYLGEIDERDVGEVPPPVAHRLKRTEPSQSFLDSFRQATICIQIGKIGVVEVFLSESKR
jgi:cytochrome b involved in lipid metabolism